MYEAVQANNVENYKGFSTGDALRSKITRVLTTNSQRSYNGPENADIRFGQFVLNGMDKLDDSVIGNLLNAENAEVKPDA